MTYCRIFGQIRICREVKEAGHMSPLTHADRVNSILEEFLKRVSAET